MRCVRLDEAASRRWITPVQAACGRAWLGDWLVCDRTLEALRTDRLPAGGGRGDLDLTRLEAQRCCRQVREVLGGDECITYQVACRVVREDRTAADIAAELKIRPCPRRCRARSTRSRTIR